MRLPENVIHENSTFPGNLPKITTRVTWKKPMSVTSVGKKRQNSEGRNSGFFYASSPCVTMYYSRSGRSRHQGYQFDIDLKGFCNGSALQQIETCIDNGFHNQKVWVWGRMVYLTHLDGLSYRRRSANLKNCRFFTTCRHALMCLSGR